MSICMAEIEKLEMDAHREQLTSDLESLIEKYRSIFGWDVPEIDEPQAERLIIEALRQALDEIQKAPRPTTPA
jgi:transketolase N-terminal domain/subunit